MMRYYTQNSELYHHGILGMHWGIRRFQDKNGHLTSAGKKRYNKGERKKLTGDQKKAIAIGTGVVAAAAIATIGGVALYKSGKLNPIIESLVNKGQNEIKGDILGNDDDNLYKAAFESYSKLESAFGHRNEKFKLNTDTAIKCVSNVNVQNKNGEWSGSNCGSTSTATLLRSLGFENVKANYSIPVTMRESIYTKGMLPDFIPKMWKGCKVHDVSEKNYTDGKQIINEIKNLGDGARGYIYRQHKDTTGHYYMYAVFDGKVHIMEGQHRHGSEGYVYSGIEEVYTNLFDKREKDGSIMKGYGMDCWHWTDDIFAGLKNGNIVPDIDLLSDLCQKS